MLDERAETIRESLEKAEETRVEAERLLDEYKVQMAEARAEAAKVIEQGRKVAETMKDEIVAKANEEAEADAGQGAARRSRPRRRPPWPSCRRSVADLSVAVAGKLIGAEALGRGPRQAHRASTSRRWEASMRTSETAADLRARRCSTSPR